MRDFRDAKAMATSLRQALAAKTVDVTHSESLELVSKAFGLDNWNILAAKIEAAVAPAAPAARTLFCSFCGKSQHDVTKLIAGPESFICNECVGLCVLVIQEGDLDGLIDQDRAVGDDAYPALSGFLRGRTREQLAGLIADTRRWMRTIDWSLHQAAAALGEAPAGQGPDDPLAGHRRWTGDPLAGKTPDEIRALQAEWTRRLDRCRTTLQVAEAVLQDLP